LGEIWALYLPEGDTIPREKEKKIKKESTVAKKGRGRARFMQENY